METDSRQARLGGRVPPKCQRQREDNHLPSGRAKVAIGEEIMKFRADSAIREESRLRTKVKMLF